MNWIVVQGMKDAPGDKRVIMDADGQKVAVATSAEYAAHIVACVNAHDALTARVAELEAALRELTERCDRDDGMREDGSNIDTIRAHAALGDFAAKSEAA